VEGREVREIVFLVKVCPSGQICVACVEEEGEMARAPWHQRTWGGKRPGAGRPPGEPTRRVTARIPVALLDRLEDQAQQQGETLSALLVEAVRRYVEGSP